MSCWARRLMGKEPVCMPTVSDQEIPDFPIADMDDALLGGVGDGVPLNKRIYCLDYFGQ